MTHVASGVELRSTITSAGELQLRLESVSTPELAPGQVLIRVEAAPINPSDLRVLFGPADLHSLRLGEHRGLPQVTAGIPADRLAEVAVRWDTAIPAGLEGAGVVVQAGSGTPDLVGQVVATFTPGMYAQYRVVEAANCIVLPEGALPRDGASAFVNPLTALAMVETMRREGHHGLVHTAAGSSLGQMLTRVCVADSIPLVNIVRSPAQVELLRELGAAHVLDSTSETFRADLVEALAATGATLAFDAVGGGTLAATVLSAMEQAIGRRPSTGGRYGSQVHKQVYVYGSLDPAPMLLRRDFGMAWAIGGWLLQPFLDSVGPKEAQRLRDRVAAELSTLFVSSYTAEISLAQALEPATIAAYATPTTGQKYLILPQLGVQLLQQKV